MKMGKEKTLQEIKNLEQRISEVRLQIDELDNKWDTQSNLIRLHLCNLIYHLEGVKDQLADLLEYLNG